MMSDTNPTTAAGRLRHRKRRVGQIAEEILRDPCKFISIMARVVSRTSAWGRRGSDISGIMAGHLWTWGRERKDRLQRAGWRSSERGQPVTHACGCNGPSLINCMDGVLWRIRWPQPVKTAFRPRSDNLPEGVAKLRSIN